MGDSTLGEVGGAGGFSTALASTFCSDSLGKQSLGAGSGESPGANSTQVQQNLWDVSPQHVIWHPSFMTVSRRGAHPISMHLGYWRAQTN